MPLYSFESIPSSALWNHPSPLLKPTSLWKPPQPCKWRNNSNSTEIKLAMVTKFIGTYRRSTSLRIPFNCSSPCKFLKYASIQVIIWSLNAPLISWCKMSGVINSWMSARGKYSVNTCKKGYSREILHKLHTYLDISNHAIVVPSFS